MRGELLRVLCVATLAGCAGGRAAALVSLDRAFEAADLGTVREGAPDLYAEAVAARAAAEASEAEGDAAAARDHATAARAWLAAASLESERIALESRRIALEVEARESAQRAAAYRRELDRRAADARREVTLRVVGDDVARVREAAAAAERAGRRRAPDDARMAAAAIVLRRAALTLAAARALGAAAEASDALASRLDEPSPADPAAALERARRLERAALAQLGEARASLGPAEPLEGLALVEAAQAQGLSAVWTEPGVRVDVDGVFAGAGARPSRAGARRLDAAAAVALAHPVGPLLVEAPGVGELARTRAAAVRRALVAGGVPDGRVVLAPASQRPPGGSASLTLLFPAYGALTP